MTPRLSAYLYDEAKATRRLVIASAAMACDRDARSNRQRLASTIETTMQQHPNVDLVLFGEMILGWYAPGREAEYHHQISEPVPGETTQALASLARRYGIYVCFGMSESRGGALHNAQVLLNPRGEIQAIHRKRNLKPAERAAGYQPGPALISASEIKGVRTGIVICSDTASPATMWALARGRFDLILHSLAEDDRDDFITTFQARMYDAWFVTANRFGQEETQYWPGLVTVTDPLGRTRGRTQGQAQVLVRELWFAEPGSWLKRIIRNLWVKAPLVLHVAKNWKRAKSYL